MADQFQELTIRFEYLVPAHIIYQTITNQMQIIQFTQCAAVSEPVPGGRLIMYNENIQGEYISLEENKRIEMNWKFKDWEAFSNVIITFDSDDDDECTVEIVQTKIPTHDKFLKHVHLDNLENGWRANIFERLSKVFGYALKK
eukprot:403356236